MLESKLTSSTAALIAGFTDLPMTESSVNRAPILITVSFDDEMLRPTTSMGAPIQRTIIQTVALARAWPFIIFAESRDWLIEPSAQISIASRNQTTAHKSRHKNEAGNSITLSLKDTK